MREKKLAVAELLLPHLDSSYNLARWIVESDVEAQAVVQEAYTYASARFEEFGGADLRIALLTIVRDRAYAWIRRRSNLSQFKEAVESDSVDKSSLTLAREEQRRYLHKALGRLPVEFREILLLCDIERCSYAQLAAVLELSTAAVASRLNQARLLLRRELTEVQPRGSQEGAVQE